MSRKDQIAGELSQILPILIRHMYPHVFGSMDVPPSQILALVTIENEGECTLTQLKKLMHVSAPTISGIVTRLERAGYISRFIEPADRRVTKVRLKNKGEKVVATFRGLIKKRWSYILSKVPESVGETVVATISQITRGFIDGTLD